MWLEDNLELSPDRVAFSGSSGGAIVACGLSSGFDVEVRAPPSPPASIPCSLRSFLSRENASGYWQSATAPQGARGFLFPLHLAGD